MRDVSGWNETWIQNIFVLYQSPIPYDITSSNCDTADLFVPYLANNTIYIPNGTEVAFTWKLMEVAMCTQVGIMN